MKYFAIVLTLLAFPASAKSLDGVYSNVCLSPETGDESGIELQLKITGDIPVVTLKTCEGGCSARPISNVAIDGNHISFDAADQTFRSGGELAYSHIYRFDGTFGNRTLDLESPGYFEHQHLEKQHLRNLIRSADNANQPLFAKRCGTN